MAKDLIEVAVSFDTTGSMYPCIPQVRRNVEAFVKRLFGDIPNLRIGFIAHGDYCDAHYPNSYVTKVLPLTNNVHDLVKFIRNVDQTNGGDSPECYELVLHEARTKMNWTAGAKKILVMIGDATPHRKEEAQNNLHLDWRNEAKLLVEAGVSVYAVQAMDYGTDTFWRELARLTRGVHLRLNQFREVEDIITASCLRQAGNDILDQFQQEVRRAGRMTRGMDTVFVILTGRAASYDDSKFEPVSPGRFQMFEIEEDTPIRVFVEEQGLHFEKGRGFYELSKAETIQDYKEIIIVDRITGDMFTGEENIRALLNIPALRPGSKEKIRLRDVQNLDKYRVFVQSTSVNRKLKTGTTFLYDIQGLED